MQLVYNFLKEISSSCNIVFFEKSPKRGLLRWITNSNKFLKFSQNLHLTQQTQFVDSKILIFTDSIFLILEEF